MTNSVGSSRLRSGVAIGSATGCSVGGFAEQSALTAAAAASRSETVKLGFSVPPTVRSLPLLRLCLPVMGRGGRCCSSWSTRPLMIMEQPIPKPSTRVKGFGSRAADDGSKGEDERPSTPNRALSEIRRGMEWGGCMSPGAFVKTMHGNTAHTASGRKAIEQGICCALDYRVATFTTAFGGTHICRDVRHSQIDVVLTSRVEEYPSPRHPLQLP